jgi:hypothetical protein
MRSALEEGHPGIYRYTPKPELDRIFTAAENQLNQPMSVLAFYRVLAPAVAALKCGHTALRLPEQVEKEMTDSIPLMPVEVRILDRKTYVFRDYSESNRLADAEIESINGVAAEKIMATMLASIHGDGDTPTAGPWRIGHDLRFAKALYALAGVESPFHIDYKLDGKPGHAVLEGVAGLPQEKRPSSAATFKLLDEGGIGVLKVYGFGGRSEDGKPLGAFFQEVYSNLHEKKVSNLIIDLRDNGGGADELGKLLFAYLTAEPFQYYSDLVINKLTFDFFQYANHPKPIPENSVTKMPNGKYRLTSHENWGTQQPRQPYFAGRVFALINGGSFSTTCEFLSTLHHHHRATFIGEEAAGGYYGNTSGPGVEVIPPNSKIRLPVRLMTYYMAIDGAEHGARSIPPDYPVTYSIEELLAGKDKEMELALRLIADRR